MSKLLPHKNEHYFLEFIYSIEYFLHNSTFKNLPPIEFVELHSPDNNQDKIIYNTEQLTRQFMSELIIPLSNKYIIFDYSSVNIEIIKSKNRGAKCVLFPILYNPKDMDLSYLDTQNKEYDAILLGTLTMRRLRFVKQLVQRGINVIVINNCFDYESKYKAIFKAKVVLNIHAEEDYQVFEYARCSVPVFNNCIVVSETSLNEKGSFINDYVLSRIIFADPRTFVDKVVEVVRDYRDYQYITDKDYLEELNKKEMVKIKEEINLLY